ncbi:hypothetical protein [uncultured Sphingomonas sp.]|uniref:hypothetical protein n=1 Tax=uncultured Sphingomonas sp. TaxID=158754 RepID=UPI0035CA19A9
MPRHLLARALRVVPLLAALALGACAHHKVAFVDAPPAVAMVDAAPLPVIVAPSQINANLSSAATVWHLRAALNVAALGCRAGGEAALAAQYNALIAAQKTALTAAESGLSTEFRAGGGKWQDRYDHAMTRLYNFFATAQAHDRFCAAAVRVMADAQGLAPGALPGFAARQLPVLDAAFAQPDHQPQYQPAPVRFAEPVIALAAGPTATQPTAHPRMELDLSALPAD